MFSSLFMLTIFKDPAGCLCNDIFKGLKYDVFTCTNVGSGNF